MLEQKNRIGQEKLLIAHYWTVPVTTELQAMVRGQDENAEGRKRQSCESFIVND